MCVVRFLRRAADVDQSGTMEYDEFVALVGQVFPQPPSSDEVLADHPLHCDRAFNVFYIRVSVQITALFRAACEASGQEDSYSFATLEGFVDAMLNSSAFKYKRHSLVRAACA